MKGYQVTFITPQGRRHGRQTVHDWLLGVCREVGVQGVTTVVGAEGIGRNGRLHAAHFFELADQPVEVVVALTPEQCDALFRRLEAEQANLFYVRTEVEFGVVGAPPPG